VNSKFKWPDAEAIFVQQHHASYRTVVDGDRREISQLPNPNALRGVEDVTLDFFDSLITKYQIALLR